MNPLWKTRRILLGTLYFKLYMLCAAPLYSPLQWQWYLNLQQFVSLVYLYSKCFCECGSLFHLDMMHAFSLLVVSFSSFQGELSSFRVLLKIQKTFPCNFHLWIHDTYFRYHQMSMLYTLSARRKYVHLLFLLITFQDYFNIHLLWIHFNQRF